MKAMVVVQRSGSGELVLEDVPDPVAGEGQVAIRMEGTAVSFGDIEMRRGNYHTPRKPPVIPGHDVVGTLVALGSGTTGLSVGERVTAISLTGTYAEIVGGACCRDLVAAGRDRRRLGRGLPDQWRNVVQPAHHGRTLGGGRIGVDSRGGRRRGDNHLPVGQAARVPARLSAPSVTNPRLTWPAGLGCDHVILYRTEDVASLVMSITGGKGRRCDSRFDRRLGYGTKPCPAWPRGGASSPLASQAGSPGRFRPISCTPETSPPSATVPAGTATKGRKRCGRAGDAVLGYLRSKQLKMVVSAQFPLSEANAALDLVASRKSTGRVVLTSS